MRQIHFISLHGFRGNPDLDYHAYLQIELGKLDYKVEIPTLPNSEQPNEEQQVSAVLAQATLDRNTVIIAHSLGCAVAMKVLERLPFSIKGLLLVAPVVEPEFCIPEHTHLAYWKGFNFAYDYDKVRSQAKKRMILSDLTEYEVRGEYCHYLSGKIEANLREITAQRKHLSGYIEPEVLKAAKEFLSANQAQS